MRFTTRTEYGIVCMIYLARHHEAGCVTIKELASIVAEAVGYDGQVSWDASKPDGAPQKLLDVSRLAAAGWSARIGLVEGIKSTVEWYRANSGHIRA